MKKKKELKVNLNIKLTPYLKNLVKASWKHNNMLYIICLSKYITTLTNYFSKTYKIPVEKVRVGTFEDLIKEVTEHNTRVLISIRDGKIICDPFNFLGSLKINIQKGLMTGTKEAILRKFLLIKDYIKEMENTKAQVFDNIYTSTVEASQTALVLKVKNVLIPRLIPEMLEKHIAKDLEKTYISYASEIIKLYKDYEHKKIELPNGKKLDEFARKVELFREAVKKMR